MIYLDHASTSYPKPQAVLDEINFYLTNIGVSPGRGSYTRQNKATDYVNTVRLQIAELFHIKKSHHISFTHNATHSLNIVLKGYLKENDHVLVCSFSHNSVIRPLSNLKHTKNIAYDVFEVGEDGKIDMETFHNLIRPNTVLVVFNHASNVIGVRAQFEKVLPLLTKRKIATMLDVTQTAGIIPLDIEALGVDFVVGSGHKTLLGPPGIGFLYVKNPDTVLTLEEGGSPANASSSPYHPEVMPEKFESGTMNYVGIAGLRGAFLASQRYSFEEILNSGLTLTNYAWQRLSSIPEVKLFGTKEIDAKVPIISFTLSNILPQAIAYHLDSCGPIAVRSGLHCAPILHKQLGTYPSGTVRISFGHSNTFEEIDILMNILMNILRKKQ